MNRPGLVSALAVVFGGLAAVLLLIGVLVEPLVALLAVPFAAVAAIMWYQGSGRLAARLYASVEERARVDDRRRRGRERRRRGRERRGREPGPGPGPGRARTDGDERTRDPGFGAGPRADWEPRDEWERRGRVGGPGPQSGNRRRRAREARAADGPTAREAYDVLGLSPDADEAAVRRAYREKVKAVHPDAEGGSEEAFKRVNAAYERLTE